MDWLKNNLMLWAVPVAAFLTAAQIVTPKFMDFALDWAVVGVVWFVVYLSGVEKGK